MEKSELAKWRFEKNYSTVSLETAQATSTFVRAVATQKSI